MSCCFFHFLTAFFCSFCAFFCSFFSCFRYALRDLADDCPPESTPPWARAAADGGRLMRSDSRQIAAFVTSLLQRISCRILYPDLYRRCFRVVAPGSSTRAGDYFLAAASFFWVSRKRRRRSRVRALPKTTMHS